MDILDTFYSLTDISIILECLVIQLSLLIRPLDNVLSWNGFQWSDKISSDLANI